MPRLSRCLHLADRLSLHGGADHHLRDLLAAQAPVTVVVGRIDGPVTPPPGVTVLRCRGLASAVASERGLRELEPLLASASIVHVHNVMNPTALALAVGTGRAVVTVQDHRVFCPGPGRTLPDGAACAVAMGPQACETCLPDAGYRDRTLALTWARRDALVGARLVVLSQYMADALDAAGLPGAVVLPPPVAAAPSPGPVGDHYLLGGRLVSHKGVDLALQAWEAAGRPLALHSAGEGPLAEALSGVRPLGWLDRAAWRQALRAARALILTPRWQEPLGIAGLEALAEGTPVIGWATGGMADWAGAGASLVTAGDVAGLAMQLQALSGDDARVAELGRAGWEAVRERPGAEELHARLESIYASAGAT